MSEVARPDEGDLIRTFLYEQTIARYMDLLEAAADPEIRERLRERLVEAEDHFASCRERLDRTSRFMAKVESRLRQQEALIDELAACGADTALPERLRQTAAETLKLFEAYRSRLQQGFEGDGP